MAVEHDEDAEEPEFGNGDTLAERIEKVSVEDDETCSVEELGDRLEL